MKLDFSKNILRQLLRVCLFLVTVAIVYQLIPQRIQFDRQFSPGKPWPYDLLTASFDFPIFKDEAELKREQDSILHYFVPYFSLNQAGSNRQLTKFKRSTESIDSLALTQSERAQLANKLRQIYQTGIMSSDQMQDLLTAGIARISIIDTNSVAKEVPLSEIYTVRSAYDALCQSNTIDNKLLRACNFNHYLEENLTYDANKSEQVRSSLLGQISQTSGLVQAGERIIDRGEIIDQQTFKILNSLKIITERDQLSDRNHYWVMAGEVLLILGLLLLFFLYLHLFRPLIFNSNRDILFIMLMVIGMIALASFTIRLTSFNLYIIPFALLPIIIRTFFDSRTALFAHIITILLTSFMVPAPFEFLLLQITVGMTVVSSLKEMSQRSQLIQTSLLVFSSYAVMYLAISLMRDGSLDKINWMIFGIFALNGLLQLFAYGLIYIFEKLFGFLSNVTLVELSNINNKLLMEFSEKAPGTFQHALQVSNLATEAAKKINANALLARTGALYHDIGKMVNPLFFTENQTPNVNPLANMPLEEAAQIVIGHVAEGVKLADKYKLPGKIKAFILTHHAESKTAYFYNTLKNNFPDQEIDEAKFTYPGPKPGSKETTIVMMADAVEASSRSLKDYNETTIDELVERIIDGQIANGSFKNAPISFRDVEVIKAIFKDKLKNIYHNRISYPELKSQKK